jgi:methyltransferase
MSNFFWVFISIVVLQRLAELFIAKRNEKHMISVGAAEFDKKGYSVIVAMHTCFFVFLIAERTLMGRELSQYWIYFFAIFVAAQALRYWSIITLGKFWNTKIIVLKDSGLIRKGPYKYFKHPNYAAVVTELAVIPLLFSCYITFVIFSVINIFVLKRRIKEEEGALRIN